MRARRGLAGLAASPALSRSAAAHSRAMATYGFFSHESRSGAAFSERIKRFYGPRSGAWTVGENLAMFGGSTPSAGAIVDAWMGSPGHRANLLRGRLPRGRRRDHVQPGGGRRVRRRVDLGRHARPRQSLTANLLRQATLVVIRDERPSGSGAEPEPESIPLSENGTYAAGSERNADWRGSIARSKPRSHSTTTVPPASMPRTTPRSPARSSGSVSDTSSIMLPMRTPAAMRAARRRAPIASMFTLVRGAAPAVLPRTDESTYPFGEEPVEMWRTPEGAGGSFELDG